MKKFAFAAIALLGICLVIPVTPSAAKPGGGGFKGGAFKGGFNGNRAWQPSFRRWQVSHNGHRFRRNNNNLIYGWGYGATYGASPYLYGAPVDPGVTGTIVQVQTVPQPVMRSASDSRQACSTESVVVPAGSGREKTVNIIRC